MFNKVEFFSTNPIQSYNSKKESQLLFIESIEQKSLPETPVGGGHNTFLNSLIVQGKIGDGDYRLSKEVKPKEFFFLEEIQKKIILILLDQTMEPKLLNGTSCTFVVKELLLDLLKEKSNMIERIVMIGGGLKKIITASKAFCEEFLTSLEVQELEKLPLDFLLEDLRKIPIHDIDFKIILKSNTDPKEISQHIFNFITSRFNTFIKPTILKNELFAKFAAPPIQEKEITEEIEFPNKITVKKPSIIKKLSYAIIAPKATVPFLEKKIPVQTEYICAASLLRDSVGVRDALEIDMAPILQENNLKNLKIKNPKSSLITAQALIDVLGGLIRIPSPETLDEMGILSIISGMLKKLVVVESETTVENLFTRYAASRSQGEETLKSLDSYSVINDINRYLDNHHKDDPIARLFFMFHFFQVFQGKIKPAILFDLFDSILWNSQLEKNTASHLIYTAFTLRMPFDVIESVLQLGTLFALNKIDIDDPEAEVCLRKHKGECFIQIRMGNNFCSHILLPLPTEKSFQTLKNYLSDKKISKEERKVIIGLFHILCSKRTQKGLKESLFAANRAFFKGKEELYLTQIEEFLKNSSPILQYIGFELAMCSKTDPYTLLPEFTKTWTKKRTIAEKIVLFQDLQIALTGTPFETMREKDIEELLTEKEIHIEILWLRTLSKIEDPKTLPFIFNLVKKALSLDLKEKELLILLDIIFSKMRIDPLGAQILWIGCQKKLSKSNDCLIREIGLIKEMWNCIRLQKEPYELQLLSNMSCIIENFLERIGEQDLSKHIDTNFRKTCLAFVDKAFVKLPFDQAKKFFSSFIEHAFFPANNYLEDYISYAECTDLRGKKEFEKQENSLLQSWNPKKKPWSAFAVVNQISHYLISKPKKGYQLLKKLFQKGNITKNIEVQLSRVLLRRVKRSLSEAIEKKEPMHDLSILFEIGLTEAMIDPLVRCIAPSLLRGLFPLEKIKLSEGYSILINCLKQHLMNADSIALKNFDRNIVYFLLIKEGVLLKEPLKHFALCADLLILILEDNLQARKSEKIDMVEILLEAIFYTLPSESNEITYTELINKFIAQLLLSKHPYNLALIESVLENEKIIQQLEREDFCRHNTSYHILYAQKTYGSQWLVASEYLLSKYECVQYEPKKWIESLIGLITTYGCGKDFQSPKKNSNDPSFRIIDNRVISIHEPEKIISKEKAYKRFDKVRQELFKHIEKLDPKNCLEYRFCFLRELLKKMAFERNCTTEIYEWMAQEIESLIKTELIEQHYEVIERYLFLIVGYRSESYVNHIKHSDSIVKKISETDFYKHFPKQWIKTQMYLRKSYEGVTGEILYGLLNNVLKNNCESAVNVAFEILFSYQTKIIKNDDDLVQLKKCYELILKIAEQNPETQVTLNIDVGEQTYFLFEGIRKIFEHHFHLLVKVYSSKNLIPNPSNFFVNYLVKTANFGINMFQHLKDGCYTQVEKLTKTHIFSPRKESFPLTKAIYIGLLPISLNKPKNMIQDKKRFADWTNRMVYNAMQTGVFIGDEGHKEYYEILSKILDNWMECMESLKDKDLSSSFNSLFNLIAMFEDNKTFFGSSPIYKNLCSPFSKEIRIKRVELFDLLFNGIWKKTGVKYKNWIKTWYIEAQKRGFYGKKRQEKPVDFFK